MNKFTLTIADDLSEDEIAKLLVLLEDLVEVRGYTMFDLGWENTEEMQDGDL